MIRQVGILIVVLGIGLMSLGGCDGPFPTQSKIGPPADHTENEDGALHKSGSEEPFSESSGCSSDQCHHSDLRGGLAEVDGRVTVAPSCYQCHGEEWDEEDAAAPGPDAQPLAAHPSQTKPNL